MSTHRPDFWTFSLSVYAEPGVQAECLALQDHYGVDVNVLLFCAYVGARYGAVLSSDEVRQAADRVAGWHNGVVKGLRGARRALKSFATARSPIIATASALWEGVKALELEAERIEQILLESWSTERFGAYPRSDPSAAIVANIGTVLAMHGKPNRRPDLPNRLIAAALAAARSDTQSYDPGS